MASAASGRDYAGPDRETYEACGLVHAQFFEYVCAVGIGGLVADSQPVGDFLRREAQGDQFHHLALPRRESRQLLACLESIIACRADHGNTPQVTPRVPVRASPGRTEAFNFVENPAPAADPVLDPEWTVRLQGYPIHPHRPVEILSVNALGPAGADLLIERSSPKIQPALVRECAESFVVRHPDHGRRGFRQLDEIFVDRFGGRRGSGAERRGRHKWFIDSQHHTHW